MYSVSLSRFVIAAASLLALSACGPTPPASAFLNRGGPESLIDVSSEVVNLSVAGKSELKELGEWIEKDHPTRATLNCTGSNTTCTEARKMLELNGIPVTNGIAAQQTVTLVYERILARDCNKTYIDNSHNHYNTNHPSFGCSVAANMVQHVTDKQELVNPALSENRDTVRAVNDIRYLEKPRERERNAYSLDGRSLLMRRTD